MGFIRRFRRKRALDYLKGVRTETNNRLTPLRTERSRWQKKVETGERALKVAEAVRDPKITPNLAVAGAFLSEFSKLELKGVRKQIIDQKRIRAHALRNVRKKIGRKR